MDGFELEVHELSDNASIGDEAEGICGCESAHFRKRNGIVLAFFQEKTSDGSGCGGAWDDDYFEAVVYLDRDDEILVAWDEWNDCSCHMNTYEVCAEWWKEPFHQTSYYGEYYEDGTFLRNLSCWSGDLKAGIPLEARVVLDRDVEAYLRTQLILQTLWKQYTTDESSRLKALPKDVMRLVLLACIENDCDDIYNALQRQAMKVG